jgi:putative flippase GtrA
VQLMVLAALKTGFGLEYLLATGLAVEAVVLHNFLWHERFTWRDRPGKDRVWRLVKFNLSNGAISIVGNLVVMKVLVGVGVNYLVANLVAIAACSIVNFVVSDWFVFEEL